MTDYDRFIVFHVSYTVSSSYANRINQSFSHLRNVDVSATKPRELVQAMKQKQFRDHIDEPQSRIRGVSSGSFEHVCHVTSDIFQTDSYFASLLHTVLTVYIHIYIYTMHNYICIIYEYVYIYIDYISGAVQRAFVPSSMDWRTLQIIAVFSPHIHEGGLQTLYEL